MSQLEREEISRLPEKYRPLTAWNYFWLMILYSLGPIGIIFWIIHATNSSNIVRRSFARSYACSFILIAIIVGILFATGGLAAIIDGFAKAN